LRKVSPYRDKRRRLWVSLQKERFRQPMKGSISLKKKKIEGKGGDD